MENKVMNNPMNYIPLCNNRVDIFEGKSGKIYCAFYSKEASLNGRLYNDHYHLYTWLLDIAWCKNDEDDLIMPKRWCGFYSFISTSTESTLILYGMSTTYPHTKYSEDTLKKAVENNFGMDEWNTPDRVILIDIDHTIQLK